MRKFLATAVVVAMATPAFAGLSLDTRYDYVSATSNSRVTSTSTSLSAFQFSRLRLAGDGKAGEITFKTRLNFMTFSSAGAANDGMNSNTTKSLPVYAAPFTLGGTGLLLNGQPSIQPNDLVDYAFAESSIFEGLNWQAGKLADVGFSGFEGQYNGGDMYFTSQSYLANKYFTGAQLIYTLADNQKLGFAFLNNNAATDQTRPSLGLWYFGTFGNFGVRASYHSLAQGTTGVTSPKDVNQQPMNIGVSYKMDDWKFELDYDAQTITNSAASGNGQTLSSIVGTARYDMGHWSPWVKIESSSRQGYQAAGADVTDTATNFSIAGEYKKNAADPFRYELAYVSGSTTYATQAGVTNTSVTGSYAFAGIRYMGDFLK